MSNAPSQLWYFVTTPALPSFDFRTLHQICHFFGVSNDGHVQSLAGLPHLGSGTQRRGEHPRAPEHSRTSVKSLHRCASFSWLSSVLNWGGSRSVGEVS